MLDEKFKLPQSSYEELAKIIKAYGHVPEPASLEEISKLIGLHHTIISRNAGFLMGIGILEGGARKVPTTNGRKLAHALEHNMPDEIRTWWQQIVSGNEFLTRLLSAIRIRNGMDQQTLEAHIAYSAGQPKKAQFMTGARTVIDILRAAELIKEAEGKYIAEMNQSVLYEYSVPSTNISLTPRAGITAIPSARPDVTSTSAVIQPGVPVRIQININCTAAELPGLGQHIKKLMGELSSPNPNTESEEERSE